ncbi:MAG: DnaJ domain-containing protein, partial [Rhodococcus sp. (in: high G+C Gram-positive bacteria)]|nr:DnaJ domain-containing protein [Rhodococcus sp. (in: high G+C Gram-positive bacteria)]
MSQREWIEKDFYKELGVSSTATADEIKKAYRKLARDLHPDANPDDAKAEERFKSVSEAHAVLSDPDKRKEYDEARRLFASGGFGPRAQGGGGFNPGAGGFDINDLFGGGAGGQDSGLGDIFGGLFNRGGAGQRTAAPNRPRRGKDLETETTLAFREAALGVTVPLRLTSPTSC